MDRNEIVEYTEEGFERLVEACDYLPEDQKREILMGIVQAIAEL